MQVVSWNRRPWWRLAIPNEKGKMRLSIITITYNNLAGLRKTATSVREQVFRDFEWIVVDGGSIDGTPEYLQEIRDVTSKELTHAIQIVSESDNGVYDAQNKGIGMAHGEYCFFLNAGDVFYNAEVVDKMMREAQDGDIVYGNEIVVDGAGKRIGYCRGVENPGFVDLYNSCMKHQASFIRRELFDRYGLYDATIRICADWDWFFRVIAFHDEVRLVYKDVDVSLFEGGGISSMRPDWVERETEIIYNRYVPKRLQADYKVFMRYPWLRQADNSRIFRFMLHVVKYLSKRLR